MIAGTAFDNGLLHFTHALEHPLSGIKPELAHGLGLSMILPAIIEECYPACSATLGTILRPLTPDLKGTPDEAHKAARGVETARRHGRTAEAGGRGVHRERHSPPVRTDPDHAVPRAASLRRPCPGNS